MKETELTYDTAFSNWINRNKFEMEDPYIALKYSHTFRVANICIQIAKSEGLSLEEQKLAYLIGILHDVGCFYLHSNNNFMHDDKDVDHGIFAAYELLIKQGLIREFTADTKYDDVIITAVAMHNQFKIDNNLGKKELIFAKILRDADKIDILYLFANSLWKQDLKPCKMITTIPEEIIRAFHQKTCVNFSENFTIMSLIMTRIFFPFDLNFKRSFEIIKKQDTIRKYTLLFCNELSDDIHDEIMLMVSQVELFIDCKVK